MFVSENFSMDGYGQKIFFNLTNAYYNNMCSINKYLWKFSLFPALLDIQIEIMNDISMTYSCFLSLSKLIHSNDSYLI